MNCPYGFKDAALMNAMTSLERTLAVLDHRVPDRVPVALHNFLMACHSVGGDFGETLQSGELLAEAHLAAWMCFSNCRELRPRKNKLLGGVVGSRGMGTGSALQASRERDTG